jgi:uncharacterized protein YecE (DUF72 family)
MSEILVGTSGYSFADWVGPFYPSGTAKGDMLAHYAREFPVVEVNATYYRMPHAAMMARIRDKAPEGFRFVVKLLGDLTHEGSRDPVVAEEFLRAMEPLAERGALLGLLAQFPWRFKNTQGSREQLAWLREAVPDHPLFAEFRHDSWIKDEVFDWLERLEVGYCSVDEPDLPGLPPPIARRSARDAYVRLHGRNARNWWGRGGGDRYDYLYSESELSEWAQKIRDLSQTARRTFVFFNNCHAGQAARNAILMKKLLDLL